MVLKHDGIIMAKDIIEFPEGTGGFDLTDISEKITDTEIFFDNADDSVVHVEVDGKSVGGGSGKNLFNAGHFVENLLSNGVSNDNISLIDIETNYFNYSTVGNMHNYISYLTNRFKENTSYTLTFTGWMENYADSRAFTTFGFIYTDGTRERVSIKALEAKSSFTLISDASKTIKQFSIGWAWDGRACIKNIQLEEGSTATAYEPPAPTPDYPIEIHSLNDFDVVSSVGKRNYILNSKQNLTSQGARYLGLSKDLTISLIKKYGFTGSIDIEVVNHKILERYNFNRLGFELEIRTNSGSVNYYQTDLYPKGEDFKGRVSRYFKPREEWSELVSCTFWIQTGGDKVYIGNPKITIGDNTQDVWTPALEDITEDSNHPLIDKINLSLSEPLRSVGDVKDRLFRDNDGIWKVERKIYSQLLNGGERWIPLTNLNDNDFVGFHFYTNIGKVGNHSRALSSHFTQGTDDIAPANRFSEERNLMGIQNVMGQTKVIIDGNILPSKDINGFRNWLENNNVRIQYIKSDSSIETLDQELQDKLNNLRSFQDSNYVYTVINDKTDILSNYVTDNLKPTLHARFKSEDYGILNNDYGINYPDKITYLGTYFKHGDLVTQEFIESED